MTHPDGPPRFGLAALAGVSLMGVASAFWRLDRADWKLDEEAYAQAGWELIHHGVDPNQGHPPLAKLLFGAAQVVLGRDLAAVRTVSALGFLVALAVLFAFGREVAGWWSGVAAAGLFAAVPRVMVVAGWQVSEVRIDRYALLEAVAGPLVLVGLWLGWRWVQRGGLSLAAGAGLCIGLAGAAKLNALVVLVPVTLVGLGLGWGRRRLGPELGAIAAAALVGFVVPFAVFGRRLFAQLDDALRFPADRARAGHLLVLGSDVYDRSPWWAHLRYQLDGDGWVVVVAVAAAVALAVAGPARRRPAVVYLLAATGALMASAMASPVALPHYRAIWTAPLLLLVAVGVVPPLEELAADRRDRSGRSAAAPAPAVVAAGVAVILLVTGAVGLVRLATLPVGDGQRVAQLAAADGVRPTRVLIYSDAIAPYFTGAVDALAPFDDGSVPAQLVVLDPSLTDAVPAATVDRWRGWARAWGLAPHRVGRLEAWWAPR